MKSGKLLKKYNWDPDFMKHGVYTPNLSYTSLPTTVTMKLHSMLTFCNLPCWSTFYTFCFILYIPQAKFLTTPLVVLCNFFKTATAKNSFNKTRVYLSLFTFLFFGFCTCFYQNTNPAFGCCVNKTNLSVFTCIFFAAANTVVSAGVDSKPHAAQFRLLSRF